MCLGVGHTFASTSSASSRCEGAFASPAVVEHATPTRLLTRLFDESQFLGLAVFDHASMRPFRHLYDIVEKRGLDRDLKTIVIEDSHVRADLYAAASVKPMTLEEFKAKAAEVHGNWHPQDEYVAGTLLPLVRKINENRADDPILIVPVDGVTPKTFLESAFGGSTEARLHAPGLREHVDVKAVENMYSVSILRERETATHFKRLVTDRFPERKSIIAYHGAHILKNLRAIGADTDAAGKVVKRSFLGWIEIARRQNPNLQNSYSVVAIDTRSDWAPNGVLDLPSGLSRHATRATAAFWRGTKRSESPLFKSGTFMATYRNSTIAPVDPRAPIFDGVIVDP